MAARTFVDYTSRRIWIRMIGPGFGNKQNTLSNSHFLRINIVKEVFDEQDKEQLDTVIYNALISAYEENEQYQDVFDLYHTLSMKHNTKRSCIKLDQVSYNYTHSMR